MKILIITPRIPYPPYRGDKLKIFNISKILCLRNEIKIISFLSRKNELTDLEKLKKTGIDIESIRLTRAKSLINLLQSLITNNPLQISYYHSKKMHQRIQELISKEKYDVIYFHLINSIQYFFSTLESNALKVIDFTDATSLYLTRYIEFLKNPLRKLVFKHELKRIKKYEERVNVFDTLFVCSPIDRNFLFERKIHTNIRLLLNGVDTETFKYVETEPQRGRIIFAGNMTYFPNIDAAIYFAKEIFPIILRKAPFAKFYIVGQQPPQEIKSLKSDKIIITGFVPNIAKEYMLSEVNVAPIRFGSGTLNKIIEPLALGVPTVATSLATKGFPNNLMRYLFTADNVIQFAELVVSLFGNENIRNGLMKESVKKISDMLSWENIVEDFEHYLKERINFQNKLGN